MVAMLNYSEQGKAEFGFRDSEFGNASLFHAGFQRIGDFGKRLCNGLIVNRRS